MFKEDVTDSRVTDLRRLKLTHEFTIAEILYFFMENPESDWQLMEPLKGDIYPILKHRITGGTNLDAQKLKSVLLESGNGGNLFAGATMFTGSIRLPPKSVLKLKWNILTITNPFGSLTFVIVENPMVNLRKPGTTIAPKLSNGKYQFETRENVIVVINVVFHFHPQLFTAGK